MTKQVQWGKREVSKTLVEWTPLKLVLLIRGASTLEEATLEFEHIRPKGYTNTILVKYTGKSMAYGEIDMVHWAVHEQLEMITKLENGGWIWKGNR